VPRDLRRTLIGRFTVAQPREAAFSLFTPHGERAWAEGWDPWFPEPEPDDAAPGTVFITRAHGHEATWIVVERIEGRRMRYARVVQGVDAGTVTVDLEDAGDGIAAATVTYDLTALSGVGRRHLGVFADGYAAELASWSAAIAAIGPNGKPDAGRTA
jgi:hypothetical protein